MPDELLEFMNRYPKIDDVHAITVLEREDHPHFIMYSEVSLRPRNCQ